MTLSVAFSNCILVQSFTFSNLSKLIFAFIQNVLFWDVKDFSEDEIQERKYAYICPCVKITAEKVIESYKKLNTSYDVEIYHKDISMINVEESSLLSDL